VVNLATYRGNKVAMKQVSSAREQTPVLPSPPPLPPLPSAQLLTVTEENVLRFRHECFLMKNLAHPNVVKLVGVCWSEDLFACCLEFVENGSLEDWLRRTAGGKKYVPPKMPVIGKKKKKKKGPSLAAVTLMGFDHNGQYDESEHTETDAAKMAEATKMMNDWWVQRMNPRFGFSPVLGEGSAPLELNVQCLYALDEASGRGRGIGHCIIDATPAQTMGFYADRRNKTHVGAEVIDSTYTTSLELLQLADKEVLYRSVFKRTKGEDGYVRAPVRASSGGRVRRVLRAGGLPPTSPSCLPASIAGFLVRANAHPKLLERFCLAPATNSVRSRRYNFFTSTGYSVEDERRPVSPGKIRMDNLFCLLVREAPGTEGKRSEVLRMSLIDPKVPITASSSAVASQVAQMIIATPLVEMKREVAKLLSMQSRIEEEVVEVELTWKGGLWKMALEAALGVQYLHHHR
jgi:hypothetical protein